MAWLLLKAVTDAYIMLMLLHLHSIVKVLLVMTVVMVIGWLRRNYLNKEELTLTTCDILDILLSVLLTSSCSHGKTGVISKLV